MVYQSNPAHSPASDIDWWDPGSDTSLYFDAFASPFVIRAYGKSTLSIVMEAYEGRIREASDTKYQRGILPR